MYAFAPEKPPSLVGRNFCLAIGVAKNPPYGVTAFFQDLDIPDVCLSTKPCRTTFLSGHPTSFCESIEKPGLKFPLQSTIFSFFRHCPALLPRTRQNPKASL
jgi:hypothetical protein